MVIKWCFTFWTKKNMSFINVEFNKKKIEAEKNGDKDAKVLYKLINNLLYGKRMEDARNRNDAKLISNKKGISFQTKIYVTKNI